MTVLLSVLLLTFLATLLVTVSVRQPSGPEGPWGSWLLVVFAWLCFATLLTVLGVEGVMDHLPGAPPVQLLAAVGLLLAFGAALLLLIDDPRGWPGGLLHAVPYVLLLACATIAHPEIALQTRAVYWSVVLVLGGAGIVGWGLCLLGAVWYLRRQQEQQARRAEQEREQEAQREQMELAAYEELGDDAPLSALLPLAFSRNQRIRRRSLARVAAFPSLPEALSELLDKDFEWAVSYIARACEAPPRALEPAFGRMLERQLESWSVLQHRENAGIWEPNLSKYFEGARKIQLAGGDLRQQLRAWHELLAKCPGLYHLRTSVAELLQPDPEPAPR